MSAPAQEPNDAAATVVKGFYAAFARRDARAMAACYAADARFTAPIYSLHGASDIGGMWSSLLKLGSDARVSSVVESSDGEHVQVRWSADYHLFGRPVHNEAVSTLEVRDGKIVSQRDEWSWSKWAAQAFPLGHVVDVPFVKAAMIRLMRGSTLAPAATR